MTVPNSYSSILYPNSNGSVQTAVLPAIRDSALSGNAADYMSKAVGGSRRRPRRRSCRRTRRRHRCSCKKNRRKHKR